MLQQKHVDTYDCVIAVDAILEYGINFKELFLLIFDSLW